MRKIQNIQGLRGIAVLLVAFSHLFRIEEKYGGNSIIPEFILFGISGVDLFFVISGFVMVSVTRGKFQNRMESLKFIYHRGARIYPIYWFYSLLVLSVYLLKPSLVNSAQENQVNILSSFLLLPQDLLPLVNVGWTLVHEMYFYLVFFLIMLFTPERFVALTIGMWGGLLIVTIMLFNPNNAYLKLVLHPLTLEFIGGCMIAIYYYKSKVIYNNKLLLLVIIISSIWLIVSHDITQNTADVYTSAWWWRILTFGLPSILIVFCLVQLERDSYILPKWLIRASSIIQAILSWR